MLMVPKTVTTVRGAEGSCHCLPNKRGQSVDPHSKGRARYFGPRSTASSWHIEEDVLLPCTQKERQSHTLLCLGVCP